MKLPLEKFLVNSNGVNEFVVHVVSPEFARDSLSDVAKFKERNTEVNVAMLMMRRYMFIEDAIREKMERER